MQPSVYHRSSQPDALAPDGAEIRNLVHRAQGATRLSVAEAQVPIGAHTDKVYHQTIYEEVWYVTAGTGQFHLHVPGEWEERITTISQGDAVLILPRHGFWVENSGSIPLTFLCIGSPPWPGDAEAAFWPATDASSAAE